MKCLFSVQLVAVFCVGLACARGALACQCGMGAHGRNAWEDASKVTENSAAIFEGTPVKFELQWNLLTVKEGDLIPAEAPSAKDSSEWAHMVITFQVQRTYKGNLGSEVQLFTGLGGGDCGANYATGISYLVYAYEDAGRLGVSMCSPGGWIENKEVKTYLRYLRHDRPTSADLELTRYWGDPKYAAFAEQRKRDAEERQKLYAAATGRICGTVAGPIREKDSIGTVAFLSTLGYSPFGYHYTNVKEDGSFCSRDLGPGKYYLYFVRRGERDALAQYYPGVPDIAKAQAIEIGAGQIQSAIVFPVPEQSSYSVRGFISADQKLDFDKMGGATDVVVLLVRSDGDRRAWYSTTAKFLLAKLAYFNFENVVPGHYVTYIMAPGPGWMTRKVEVDVTTHMKLISLSLSHAK